MMDPRSPDSAANQPPQQAHRAEPTPVSPDRKTPDRDLERDDEAYQPGGRPVTEVHQWLDGEASEAEARRADEKDTELWLKIQDEADRRARMVTPAPVKDGIMAAIQQAPKPQGDGVLGKLGKLFKK